uniref:Sec16 Sec23-binding domain-containing protein n=1 Tax=Anopheles minimus TaxID=112268 RepID=A0A182WDD2_9DIPT
MAEQFSASAAFKNMNNNTDGWGDDWGDWNDNAGTTVDTANPKTIGTSQAPNAPPNAYFQQQPQQHLQAQYQQQPMNPVPAGATFLNSGTNRMDQHNHNFLPNFPQGNGGYQQQMMAPTGVNQYPSTNYAPPQQTYGQTNNFFNAPPSHPAPATQRPPSHPPPSTTPQLVPTFSQTISDSFDTTAGNSWNWTVPEPSNHAQQSVSKLQSEESVAPNQLPQQHSTQRQYEDFPQPGNLAPANAQVQRLKAETLSPQWSIESQVSSSDRSLESDPSGDNRGTSHPNLVMPDEDVTGGATGSANNVKTSGVENAERPQTSYAMPFSTSAAPPTLDGGPDKLDEVLEALSIKQEARETAGGHTNLESNYRGEQMFPPPPPSIVGTPAAGPLVNESLSHVSKSSSTTPPLPPPPIDNPAVAPLVAGGGPPPPSVSGPPMVSGPPPKAMQIAGSNPFKRAGPRSHTATPGLGIGPASPAVIVPQPANTGGTFFYQQQTQPAALLQPAPVEEMHGNNIESLTPENQEILVETRTEQSMENQEIAPNNDRNQYLQTGHLSEDGYGAETPSSSVNSRAALQVVSGSELDVNHGDANDGRLPPPGLSRYVPGQNEQQPEPFVQSSVGQSFPEPPPGLDRMVPGMDLQNVSDLSLERQADGEVSDSTPAPAIITAARNDHLHHHHNHHGHHHMSDRNLYRVPGEDDNHNHHNQQRVVPGGGLENERPISSSLGVSAPSAVPSSVIPGSSNTVGMMNAAATLDMPEEQRELVMDGENPDDQREDSLVGGNALPVTSATGSGAGANGPSGPTVLETESNVTADTTSRMEPSNTSTADESDKGGFYHGAGGSSKGTGRREDDNLRRSNKSKSSRDRYDTEDSDYSDHERRRRERETSAGVAGSSAVADASSQRHERSRRIGGTTGDRDKDKRKDNGRDRDRDRERDRDRDRDYDYRDRERNRYDRERERYGRSSKYDRESRYETDGSKYETERSTRYDKEDKRYGGSSRDDYYRKRDERGPTDDARGAAGRDRDRDTLERRQRKEKERAERYRGDERRKDDRYREGEKRRDRHDRRYDPEDYRAGSRNGTERDRPRDNRERDERKEKDRKYTSTSGSGYGMIVGASGAYGPSSGYYDQYSYYVQHQQYYEQLRRTNPQAYAEWYRTYYAQMQASQMQRDLLTTDGRESVHSGRSSANDKERFNRTTPFMHPPGVYNPEEYHRHYNNQSLPSATAGAAGPSSLLDQSYHLTDVSGQPSSLPPMFHHHHPHAFQQQTQQSLLHQQQQLHQRANTSLAMDRTYHSEAGGYFQPRIDQIDASTIKPDTGAELTMMEPERLTPRKFPEIHPIVSVSAGLLVSTKNRLTMNGMADTVKIYSLGYNDASRKLFQTYPGPLVKGVTHKKSVIEFCEEQLRQGPPYSGALALIKSRGNSINSLHSSSLAAGVNRSSFALLWNYIILLLRQNGTFVGTDISELLMRNKEEYPFESIQTSVTRSANISGRNSSLSQAAAEREADARQEGESEDAGEVSQDGGDGHGALVEAAPKSLTELEITDKFRSYLLYGNISEALEWATEHNLWGHALFLASKVDSRQHANVMMKFANKLTLNDPLQTLYQLLSGRTPASVTSVLDEKWGDWRPHLAMLMSNSSAKPELIKKSITTLGDTLHHRGDLYAAHFCYLLSDVAFGRFADVKPDVSVGGGNNGTVRLVLLGAAHHNRSFREVSTNESIMMTEIYEYARSLNEDRYSIAELQRFKYLLACRMLDQGMQLKCLLYMEQIADQIQYDSYSYDADFVRKVYTLGDRLKYYDPVMEKALDESVNNTGRGNIYANVEDPQWLKRLNEIFLNSSSNGASQYNNVSDGQAAAYDYNSYGYGADQTQTASAVAQERQLSVPTESNDINKQFNEISQQLGQLNLQYNEQQQTEGQQYPSAQPNSASFELNPPAVPNYDQGYESINQQSLMDPAVEQTTKQLQNNYEQQQQFQVQQQQFNQYNSYDEHQQQEQQQQQQMGGPSFFTPAPANNEPMGSTMGPAPYDAGYWGNAGNSEEQMWRQQQQQRHFHQDEDDHDLDEEDEEPKECDRSSLSPSPGIEAIQEEITEGDCVTAFDYHRPAQQQQRDACVSSIITDGNDNPSRDSATSSPLSETFRGNYCANKCDERHAQTLLQQRHHTHQQQQEHHHHQRKQATFKAITARSHTTQHLASAPVKHVQFSVLKAGMTAQKSVPNQLVVRKVRKKRRKVSITEGAAILSANQMCPERRSTGMKLSKAYLYSARSRRDGFLTNRDVVYNGTYPIDMPFCSRFKDYNYSGESTDTGGNSDARTGEPVIDEGIRDYFEGAPKPTISMPNSVSKRPGFGDDTDDERTGGRGGAAQQTAPGGKPQQMSNAAAQAKKAPAAKDGKPAGGTAGGNAQGSGWFGGIWNKLSLKPKNQMILPDDKNPKIVWDEVTKRWVNTDENETETEAYKPPPKMSDLVSGAPAVPSAPSQMGPLQDAGPAYQQPPPAPMGGNVGTQIRASQPMGNVAGVMQPNVATVNAAGGGGPVGEPTKVPTLQSNMYKMQRNRTLKRSYVDVFNPSGAAPSKPTEPVLAPTVPTLPNNTPGSFFVPGAAPNSVGAEQQPENVSEGMPQFYNPNQFAGGPGGYQQ